MVFDLARRRPRSLALRLTVSIGLAIVLMFWGLGWLIQHSIEQHFIQQDVEELEVVAHAVEQVLSGLPDVVGAAVVASAAPNQDIAHRLAGAVSGHHGMYYHVADSIGRTLFATPGPEMAALAQTQPAMPRVDAGNLQAWQEQGQSYRGAVLRVPGTPASSPQYTLVVATGTGFHEHFLVSFRRTVWMAMAGAGLFAIGAIWLAVYRGHAPLREMSDRIRGISANQLDLRLDPQKVPIELAGLAGSFNAMLAHVEQDFKRLSNFSADIAHELRTPITNLTTQTQVLLSQARDADAYREVLYSNLEEYERMAKMISDMLYLAQTDNQLVKPDWVDVDMVSELAALFEYFEPWADERHVQLKYTGQMRPVRGDRLMLRRALSNLLSNAIRHTASGQTVTVSLCQKHSAAIITVSNPGGTIAAEHLPHLFDRFYRVDPSRQRNGDGAGLGLAIVKSIVEAHGGEICVRSDNGCTGFEMHLPLAQVPVSAVAD
ncbi:Cu(+)/Ag(+) sensor histidine kinase [Roseateles koreensis]|uniref:Sensor protein n=1 Tax=Roseateles koreensis TaxID=2987526 RepID=A0ABT5KT43_9BURK|nr:Cu(+)/Ag(+) sensor histidine kinase [Roseateles koreensis]MDC8786108.1 Cu(+)/Ag(+) sensor histidine kinase [Roseateles koreensis]